jgi:hypothetical protein
MESFVWRGLNFRRLDVDPEDPQVTTYQSGNWVVWGGISREDPRMWWAAKWQSTQYQPTLAPKGQAETYVKALEICLGRVRAHARAQSVRMEDLQRSLALMLDEKDALVRDLLQIIPDKEER